MDRLIPEQARKIKEALGPPTGYQWRVVDRLVKVGLDTRDPKLTRLATKACVAMHALEVELRYQSCGRGVRRPPATWRAGRSATLKPLCRVRRRFGTNSVAVAAQISPRCPSVKAPHVCRN
jgi:hypothetical protein